MSEAFRRNSIALGVIGALGVMGNGGSPSGGGGAGTLPLNINFLAGTMVDTVAARAPAFTRATAKGVFDFEGAYRTLRVSEVPFQGLRRVCNLVEVNSDTCNGATFQCTRTTGIADPFGGTSAITQTCTAGGNGQIFNNGSLGTATHAGLLSVWARRRTGTGSVALINNGAAANGTTDITAALTSSWQRMVSSVITTNTTCGSWVLRVSTVGDEVDWYGVMVEFIDGQLNTNPSEYVSRAVLSTPFQGAGVDGTKYFANANGNTVAGSIVTNATGAAFTIPRSAPQEIEMFGYMPEPAGGNACLQSENFGTTWTAVGTPTRSAAAFQCGDAALDLIGDDDALALEGYTQPITFTGDAVKCVSMFIRRGTSASSVIRLRDTTAGADRLFGVVTWSLGAPVFAMTTGTAFTRQVCNTTGGVRVFRIYFLTSAVTAANVNQIEIYPATDAALSVVGTGDISVGGVQCANEALPTSYVRTTTAAVTRNADVMSLATGGWYNAAAGTVIATTYTNQLNAPTTGDAWSLNDGTVNERAENATVLAASTTFLVVDGGVTQASLATGVPAIITTIKTADAYAVNDFAGCMNGGAVATDVSGTLPTVTSLNIGHARGALQYPGGLRAITYYNIRQPDAMLQALTV